MLMEKEAQSCIQSRQLCKMSYILSLWCLKIKAPADLNLAIASVHHHTQLVRLSGLRSCLTASTF